MFYRKEIDFRGTKFHYVEAGSRDQPVILLLHGFPDCWLSWRYQIPILSTYFRVIAIDLKGFGDSEKPMWHRSYRIELILEELRQFISVLGVSYCSIIGHDLGALIGWFFVHQSPELVDRFVAVSCSHPNVYWKTFTSQSLFNYNWVCFVQLPYLPETDALNDDLKIISDAHKHLQQKDAKDEYLEAYKYSFSRKEDWVGPINYYRTLPFVRICEKSEQTRVTTLLVQGDKDYSISLEGVVKSTEYCEKFALKMIEGAAHFPHQENPDMFNREILKFLKIGSSTGMFERSQSKSIMDRMFGAVSSTVNFGNSMFDTVHKRTKNGVVSSIPAIGLSLAQETSLVRN
ncbi:hypothetical protein ILUMI_19751 [Ignelater luminosus]|uniref:AB hydrolase-1 domain-containing protein n=1 Tax=Ignelater luminosus TaxID=2038154 RepID=A0A8K0G2W9_IGNLU|nr:hypothetical protein ILUMI_19751 [Ignelater luminosus]